MLSGGQPLELFQSYPTRWGSTYLMLERIVKLQQPLCAVLLEKPCEIRYLLPDGEEWTIIEEVLTVLKPFHRATTAMSASSYPTLSMLSPLLYKLLNIVLKVDENDTNSGKNSIENNLCSRYASLDLQQIYHIAAFVDPRFKDLDPFIPESDREDVRESVKLEKLKNDNSEAGAHSTRPKPSTYVSDCNEVLSLPLTSVRSEEAFSTAGNVLTKKRN